jgi:hypothetical protein
MDQVYTLFEHRHKFAVWAAARAAQRGFTSVSMLKKALEASLLPGAIENRESWPESEQFDSFHRNYCTQIMGHLKGVPGVSYGRAAKLVAVYLKTMIVLSEHGQSYFAGIIHPPVDRTLLQTLAKDPRFDQQFRKRWRTLNWTSLSESKYFELIGEFRQNLLDKPAFWKLERYWDPAGDQEA